MGERPQYGKFFGFLFLGLALTIPVFRSGGKTNLTFFGWLRNHTIFAPAGPEYVPRESYMEEMQGIKCVKIAREV